jgi:hypothetical protein
MTNRAKRLMSIAGGFAVLALAVCFISVPTGSKPALPSGRLPPGFVAGYTADNAAQVILQAKKPHGAKACMYIDPDTELGFSWTAMPDSAADMMINAQITQEQETSDIQGAKTEPAGKEGLNGGTLLYKKTSRLQIGTNCPPWVTYDGLWIGKVGEGVLVVAVSNVPGSKGAIKGWIESMIR